MFEDEDELISAVCDEEQRPKIPEDCPPSLRELIEACWHPDPEKRYLDVGLVEHNEPFLIPSFVSFPIRPTFQSMLEKMVFEKILIEHSLQDAAGRDFWTKYFLTQVN